MLAPEFKEWYGVMKGFVGLGQMLSEDGSRRTVDAKPAGELRIIALGHTSE